MLLKVDCLTCSIVYNYTTTNTVDISSGRWTVPMGKTYSVKVILLELDVTLVV